MYISVSEQESQVSSGHYEANGNKRAYSAGVFPTAEFRGRTQKHAQEPKCQSIDQRGKNQNGEACHGVRHGALMEEEKRPFANAHEESCQHAGERKLHGEIQLFHAFEPLTFGSRTPIINSCVWRFEEGITARGEP
jgi:hypothetical protein